jgi:hypothetical protein
MNVSKAIGIATIARIIPAIIVLGAMLLFGEHVWSLCQGSAYLIQSQIPYQMAYEVQAGINVALTLSMLLFVCATALYILKGLLVIVLARYIFKGMVIEKRNPRKFSRR